MFDPWRKLLEFVFVKVQWKKSPRSISRIPSLSPSFERDIKKKNREKDKEKDKEQETRVQRERTQLRGEGDGALLSRGRPLGEHAQSGPRSRHLDHPPRSTVPLPVPGDRGQSTYPIRRAPRGGLCLRARRVSNLREGEVRVLGLELDVHLPPLRVFLAGSVPTLLTNQAKRIHSICAIARICAQCGRQFNESNRWWSREEEEKQEEKERPGFNHR